MKKYLAILGLLVFGIAQVAFAGNAVLSDNEMDNIDAGYWVITKDMDGNETVNEVWYSTNDIKLKDESQTELKAVNNANVVDSAVATQTNVARVSMGDTPTTNVAVNGTNRADILNYNPSESGSEYSKAQDSDVQITNAIETFSLNENMSMSHSEASSTSAGADLNVNITYNEEFQAQSMSESEDKGSESESMSQEQGMKDLDVVIVGTAHDDSTASESFTASKTKQIIHAEEINTAGSIIHTEESGSEYRTNLSENNHIELEDVSQKLLQAVTNLNAVGSGAAMQTNIADNVGVSGSITHLNEAKVVNGM